MNSFVIISVTSPSPTTSESCSTDERYNAKVRIISCEFHLSVSGRVGLREVVDTFIDLNEDKPLSQFDKEKTVFADTLKFTTTWTGAATLHIQIDPIGTQFGLDSPTNIGLSASRADTHTLTGWD